MTLQEITKEISHIFTEARAGAGSAEVEKKLAIAATKLDYLADHSDGGNKDDLRKAVFAIDNLRRSIREGASPLIIAELLSGD